MNVAPVIANGSHTDRTCDGYAIANRIANGSQNVASNRHRVSSSVLSLVETSPSIVTYVMRPARDGWMGAARFIGGVR